MKKQAKKQQGNATKKQQGFSLIELMFVMIIAVAIILAGTRFFSVYRKQERITEFKYNVQVLLNAVNSYYKANCVTDVLADDFQKRVNAISSDGSKEKDIDYDTLLKDGFVKMDKATLTNLFGKYKDGEDYKLAIMRTTMPGTIIKPSQLNQTWLWQTEVRACITTFSKKEKSKVTLPNGQAIQLLFGANTFKEKSNDCPNGIELSWISTPRMQQIGNNETQLTATRTINNNTYRYGAWMRAGAVANKYNLPKRLNYLCQT